METNVAIPIIWNPRISLTNSTVLLRKPVNLLPNSAAKYPSILFSLLWNPKVHYWVHKNLSLVPVLSQSNPVPKSHTSSSSSLAPRPSVGLGLLLKIRLNFLEASQQFSFYRLGLLAPRPTPIPEDHASVFIPPRGRVATHFSRLLRHAWVTVSFNINLSSLQKSSKWCRPFGFFQIPFMNFSSLTNAYYMSFPSHLPLFHHRNYAYCGYYVPGMTSFLLRDLKVSHVTWS
jgi:hypothetical protein